MPFDRVWSSRHVIAAAAPPYLAGKLPLDPASEQGILNSRHRSVKLNAEVLAASHSCSPQVLDALATDSASPKLLRAITEHRNITEATATRVVEILLARIADEDPPGSATVSALMALCGRTRPSVYIPQLIAAGLDMPIYVASTKQRLLRLADDDEYLAMWRTGHPAFQAAVLAAAIAGDTGLDAEQLWRQVPVDRRVSLLSDALNDLPSTNLPHWVVDEVAATTAEGRTLEAAVERHNVDRYAAQVYLGSGRSWLVTHAIDFMKVADADLVDDALLAEIAAGGIHPYTQLRGLFGDRMTEPLALALVRTQSGYGYEHFYESDAANTLQPDSSDELIAEILGRVSPDFIREWLAGCLQHQPTAALFARLSAANDMTVEESLAELQPPYLPPALAGDLLNLFGTELFSGTTQAGHSGIPAETVAAYTRTRLAELGDNPDTWAVAVNLVESMHAETVDDFIAAAIAITS